MLKLSNYGIKIHSNTLQKKLVTKLLIQKQDLESKNLPKHATVHEYVKIILVKTF